MTIDIGADAIDREYASNNAVYNQCYIEGHPATASRTVRKIRIFIKGSIPYSLQIGSMYKTNGNVFSSRDWGIVLQPVDGLNEYTRWQHEGSGPTVDIEMEVQAGDYIGVRMWHAPSGNGIAVDTGVGLGRWRTLTEDVSFPFTDKEFNFLADQLMSLNGEMVPAIIPPTVTTDPATDLGAVSATLNGTLDDDGGEACACGFEWGETIAYGNTTPTQSKETGESFSQAISGLSSGITYHFRALATNSQGTSYGSDRTFTTSIVAPSVTTNPATEVSILNGTLDDDGGEACACGFEWGETIAYGNVTLTQSKETGETFAHLLGELSPATTYHFRAFATNSKGTSYGSDQSFTTPAGLPILTTEAASAIGLNEATLNGTLDDDGSEPCYCGFEWGATIAYGSTTPTQRKVTGEVFSQPILNLGEAAQYHFRAFATNSSGTAYGEDRTIDTLFRTNKAYALARHEV